MIVALASACSDPPAVTPHEDAATDTQVDAQIVIADPPDGTDQSGTRLKRKLMVAADGFKVQDGWYDSLLQTDCSFVDFEDGSSRCVGQTSHLSVIYRDNACTDLVLWSTAAPTRPIISTSGGCEKVRLWKDPQAITKPTTTYSRDDDGTCMPTTTNGTVFYTVTAVPSTDYVGATIASEPAGTQLRARVRVTDDGGREFLNLEYIDLGTGCLPERRPDGVVRCTPTYRFADGQAGFQIHADSGCTEALHTYRCEPGPAFSSPGPSASCPYARDYHSLTAYTGPVFLELGPSTCVATSASGYYSRESAAAVADSVFVGQTSTIIETGTTRVRRHYSVLADGSLMPNIMWDTKHDVQVSCESRCLPSYAAPIAAYSDAACTQPLALNTACGGWERPSWAAIDGAMFYRVTGDYPQATAYRKTESNACIQYTFPYPLLTIEATQVTDWEQLTSLIEP
jgi:hypothetical protein